MQFTGGRKHPNPQFDLNGGLNGAGENDYKRVVRAARDAVQVPTEPAIAYIAEKALCKISLGVNCFILTNVYGAEAPVPYGASLEDWQRIATSLLNKAMNEEQNG